MIGLVAAGAGCGAAAQHTTPHTTVGGSGQGVPTRDSFEGSIRSATGKYFGYNGRFHIYLRSKGSGSRRPVTIIIAGLPCAGASHCLELSGTLPGTLTPSPVHIADVGHRYLLAGSGSIHPIGQATARGEVAGTGFIRQGHETLTLALTGAFGSITLDALSPSVGGFTSP
jgi:hypothetical protein